MLESYNKDFIEYLPEIKMTAYYISNKFAKTFVVNELVNEAWMRGIEEKELSKRQFISRVKYDMLDYVRSIIGREKEGYDKRCKHKVAKSRPIFFSNSESSEEGFSSDGDKGFTEFQQYKSARIKDKNLEYMENKELIDMILKTPTDRQIRIITEYYYGDKLLKDIGAGMGLAECTVSTLMKRGLKSCRGVAQGMESIK